MDAGGDVICHGVVLGRTSVLTTATCMTTDKDLSLIIGEQRPLLYIISFTQPVALVNKLTFTLICWIFFCIKISGLISLAGHSHAKINASQVIKRTLHNRYMTGNPDDDLAFLELKEPIALGQGTGIIQLCLPEKDFSENILMMSGKEGVVVGGANKPSYVSLDLCHSKLNLSFPLTNKMFCMEEQEPDGIRTRSQYKKEECDLSSGSPAATVEGNTAFLTGLFLSQSDCSRGLVFTKISRYLPWIRKLLLSTEAVQT